MKRTANFWQMGQKEVWTSVTTTQDPYGLHTRTFWRAVLWFSFGAWGLGLALKDFGRDLAFRSVIQPHSEIRVIRYGTPENTPKEVSRSGGKIGRLYRDYYSHWPVAEKNWAHILAPRIGDPWARVQTRQFLYRDLQLTNCKTPLDARNLSYCDSVSTRNFWLLAWICRQKRMALYYYNL